MSSLERRLQETEDALYGALLALEAIGSIGSASTTTLAQRTLSKIEKQEEWARLPLGSSDQLAVWFCEKQSTSHVVDHQDSPQNIESTSSRNRESRKSSCTLSTIPQQYGRPPVAALQQLPPELDLAEAQHREPEAQSDPGTTRPKMPNQWRNYF
jgi:hypothetical protein